MSRPQNASVRQSREDQSITPRNPQPGSHGTASHLSPSLLDGTLGLAYDLHSEYVGSSMVYEPVLIHLDPRILRVSQQRCDQIRQVDADTTFINRSDQTEATRKELDSNLDLIESLVKPFGTSLVKLYFRIVHPAFPILDKAVFLEKYARSYREFSPPLLAAVYLLALDWWIYDRQLSSRPKPDHVALEEYACRTMRDAVMKPKLSTLQAGLLLLQRNSHSTWPFTSELLAVGEGLGIHLDCTNWDIPVWEKRLRRRLAWTLYIQDKWGALIHGRPSHIHKEDWIVQACSVDDFVDDSTTDSSSSDGDLTEATNGAGLFLQLVCLTEIVSDILQDLYSARANSIIRDKTISPASRFDDLLGKVKHHALRLRQWYRSLPDHLLLGRTEVQKLCPNGKTNTPYYDSSKWL